MADEPKIDEEKWNELLRDVDLGIVEGISPSKERGPMTERALRSLKSKPGSFNSDGTPNKENDVF